MTAISTYPGCGGVCYAFVLVDNSVPPLDGANPITTRVGQLLRAGGINGVQGLYLKQVAGPVLSVRLGLEVEGVEAVVREIIQSVPVPV